MLLRDKAHVHGPAQRDCGICHRVNDVATMSQASLRVGVVAPEPRLCTSCHRAQQHISAGHARRRGGAATCTQCHDPHASDEATLLRHSQPKLCLKCHELASLQTRHAGQLGPESDCSRCHTIHGSRLPWGGARLHAALASGCATCHAGASQALAATGDDALCTSCHPAPDHAQPHVAIGLVRCIDCHDPHAASAPALLSRGGVAVCVSCHEAQQAGADEKAHGAVAAVGCHACHEPHGGERAKLLRAEGNALCLACHDRRQHRAAKGGQVRLAQRFDVPAPVARRIPNLKLSPDETHGHPVAGHPLRGAWTPGAKAAFDGTLSCVTCHDPHKSARLSLLRGPGATAADSCRACHPTGAVSSRGAEPIPQAAPPAAGRWPGPSGGAAGQAGR
jgi:predicted CXXCH cytochrome family protein